MLLRATTRASSSWTSMIRSELGKLINGDMKAFRKFDFCVGSYHESLFELGAHDRKLTGKSHLTSGSLILLPRATTRGSSSWTFMIGNRLERAA